MKYECLYCGKKFEHTSSSFAFFEDNKAKCPVCKETKLLEERPDHVEKGDVFGYKYKNKDSN